MRKFELKLRDFAEWLPGDDYHRKHLARIYESFSLIPCDRSYNRCILIGSWGLEAQILFEFFGAREVACVHAPSTDAPQRGQSIEVSVARRCNPVEIKSYSLDLEKSDIPPELSDFDLCIAWEVLEHLSANPAFFIWQCVNTLRIGGYISLTTPNILWYNYTVASLHGYNDQGLKLQTHQPYATHWREYSPREVADMLSNMGCEVSQLLTFPTPDKYSVKSWLFQSFIRLLRKGSGNGRDSLGRHVYAGAIKRGTSDVYNPTWLFPAGPPLKARRE